MLWFYRLTLREKALCALSLIVILSSVWLYLTDFLEKEKQWYLEKINAYSEPFNRIEEIKKTEKIQEVVNDKPPYIGNILSVIQESLTDVAELQLLSIDAYGNNVFTIKLKGSMVSTAEYLSIFKQKNPNFHWNYIIYQQINGEGVLEFKTQAYTVKGVR